MQHTVPKSGKTTAKGVMPLQQHLPAGSVRQTWLHYYNDYLRKKQIITEEEWRKMRRMIEGN